MNTSFSLSQIHKSKNILWMYLKKVCDQEIIIKQKTHKN